MERKNSEPKRIAVFSDTHGNKLPMRQAVDELGPFDMMMHLGDGALDGKAVAQEFNIPFCGIAGNEDLGQGLPETQSVTVSKWLFFLIHGFQTEAVHHKGEQARARHINRLCRIAEQKKARIILTGHTHEPLLKEAQGIILCNPGDQHMGSSSPPTFALIRVSEAELDISVMKRDGKKKWTALMRSNFQAAGT